MFAGYEHKSLWLPDLKVFDDNYKLINHYRDGRFSQVWKAFDITCQDVVAIKRPLLEDLSTLQSQKATEIFNKEILNYLFLPIHRNLNNFRDIGILISEGRVIPCLIMDFVDYTLERSEEHTS